MCMNLLVCVCPGRHTNIWESSHGKFLVELCGLVDKNLGAAVKGEHSVQVLIALTELQIGVLLFLPC